MSGITIGQLAARAGVGVETVRYYERRGLLKDPPRNRSGYRAYPDSALIELRFVRRAKELGFTLSEISELLSLRNAGDTSCGDMKTHARAKLDDIERRLRDLTDMRDQLRALIDRCRDDAPLDDCPIIDSLEGAGHP